MGRVDTAYVSDHTKFIDEQLARHPEWVEEQRQGRAIWWDKKLDLEESRRNQESRVPNKAYPYDVNFFDRGD